MNKNLNALVAGAAATALLISVGLWANFALSGDPLAVATAGGSWVNSGAVLTTSLFVGLSGGHYIGGSFREDESQSRWFALGANLVLWSLLIGFIGFQLSTGGNIVEPALYAGVLILSGVLLFSLHNAGLIESESRLDDYIGSISSKGTGVVITIGFIVRTVGRPVLTAAVLLVGTVVALLLWQAYGHQILKVLDGLAEKVNEIRTA